MLQELHKRSKQECKLAARIAGPIVTPLLLSFYLPPVSAWIFFHVPWFPDVWSPPTVLFEQGEMFQSLSDAGFLSSWICAKKVLCWQGRCRDKAAWEQYKSVVLVGGGIGVSLLPMVYLFSVLSIPDYRMLPGPIKLSTTIPQSI